MNARWQHQPVAHREVVDLCATTLAKLRAGEHEAVLGLIAGVHGATGIEGDPVATQALAAARGLAVAWGELCDKASRQEQALAETREHAAQLAGQLDAMVGVVRDALPRPPGDRLAARGSSSEGNPAGKIHTLTLVRGNSVSAATTGTVGTEPAAPVLAAYLLGPFQALVNDQLIADWLNCKGKAIFKYLLLNRNGPVAKEVLMEIFWPEAEPEAARNNLNVAIHRLRRALGRGDGEFPFVLFCDGHYLLNPNLEIWTDADWFLVHAQRASELERDRQLDGAMREYAACVALYQDELLAEDRYDQWLSPLRQQFRDRYLHILDRVSRMQFDRRDYASCTTTCAKILAVDACNEGAHRMLMRCYARLGQPQLAQRQYQTCIRALNRELGIPASAETTGLYRQIVRRLDA